MKRHVTGFTVVLVSLLALSCEQPFNPKSTQSKTYVLTCILTNSGRQTALLSRSYDVAGYDPAVNTDDPAVRGARIILRSSYTRDTLKEYSTVRKDSSRYGSRLWYYAGTRVGPSELDTITITATLPDSTVLWAGLRVPRGLSFEMYPELPSGLTGRVYDAAYGKAWTVDWSANAQAGSIFFPRLLIYYRYRGPSGIVSRTKQIPARVVMKDGVVTPAYPTYTSRYEQDFEYTAIEYGMLSIVEGDTVRRHYTVDKVQFEIQTLDQAAANYFSSTNGYLDSYSIRADQIVYSNVSGGKGVFGVQIFSFAEIVVDPRYLVKLGFQQ